LYTALLLLTNLPGACFPSFGSSYFPFCSVYYQFLSVYLPAAVRMLVRFWLSRASSSTTRHLQICPPSLSCDSPTSAAFRLQASYPPRRNALLPAHNLILLLLLSSSQIFCTFLHTTYLYTTHSTPAEDGLANSPYAILITRDPP
jgi:hypothetical protein